MQGYRLDGVRIYKVKGKRPSRRKTFKTKKSALLALKRKRKRK